MTVINYNEQTVAWETSVDRVTSIAAVVSLRPFEQFVSVGTPSDRSLGASIVDDFADDLRRLADA